MPRFYFRIHDGIDVDDSEGAVHRDLTAALEEATESARELLANGDRMGRDRRHWAIEVLNANRVVVGSVKFADTIRPDHAK